MHDGNNADIIRRLADRQLKASRILNNPYFTRLKSGEMTLPVFRRTQEQFYFAVEYFSRPMAALLMRLPRPEQRLSILSNVVEEHGGFHTSAFHEATFREFLASIGGQSEGRDPAVGDRRCMPSMHRSWQPVAAMTSTLASPVWGSSSMPLPTSPP